METIIISGLLVAAAYQFGKYCGAAKAMKIAAEISAQFRPPNASHPIDAAATATSVHIERAINNYPVWVI